MTSGILLDGKGDPELLDRPSHTPLHDIGQDHACLIKRSVELGADINSISRHRSYT